MPGESGITAVVVSAGMPDARDAESVFEKFVIEDGGHQPKSTRGIASRSLVVNQPSLAKNAAVLLSGDFFGHFKNQFHQRICRQLFRPEKQYTRLADVLDRSLVPGMEIFPPVSDR